MGIVVTFEERSVGPTAEARRTGPAWRALAPNLFHTVHRSIKGQPHSLSPSLKMSARDRWACDRWNVSEKGPPQLTTVKELVDEAEF